MTDRSSKAVSATDAIAALRARGITNPEQLVDSTNPTLTMTHVQWFDQQANAKPGLLVWRIRTGGGVDKTNDGPEPGSKRAEMRATFIEITRHFPEGNVTESHKRLQRRRDYDEDCDGLLVVVEPPAFPSLVARCDACGFEVAYTFKALAGGVLPDRPPVDPRPVPDPQPQVPAGQHRSQPLAGTRDLQPARMDERSLRWRR